MFCRNLNHNKSGLISIHWPDPSLPFVFPGFSSSGISISGSLVSTPFFVLTSVFLDYFLTSDLPTFSFSFMQLIDVILKNHLFIYGCAGSLLCRLSLVAVIGSYSSLWHAGFSLWWLVLWSTGSRHTGPVTITKA